MFTDSGYYSAMDRFGDDVIEPLTPLEGRDDSINLGTADIGTTTNPMGNALQSLRSRINEGAGRLEFEFIGKGKGNSQSPTPESYGHLERQDMKELLTINDIKASVHASVHGDSLAGFGQRGFSAAAQSEALKEIDRSIDFAGDVTDGGAIVFHLSEWQRPMSEIGKSLGGKKRMFTGYESEEKDATVYVVDQRNGRLIDELTRDTEVFLPKFRTIGEEKPDLVGKVVNGHKVSADDWIDIKGNPIPKETTDTRILFDRVPKFREKTTNFEIEKKTYDDFVQEALQWKKEHPGSQKTPSQIFAETKLQNAVLQAKGSSLFYARQYEEENRQLKKLRDAHEFFKGVEDKVPEDELWRYKRQFGRDDGLTIPDNELPSHFLDRQIKLAENSIRHIHEASAAADAQAEERINLIENLRPAEQYGLEKSAEAIAKVGLSAYEKTKQKKLDNPLYAAPENFDQHLYGSHPDEMRKVIEESRRVMAKRLLDMNKAHSEVEAKKLAEQHIRGTLDIGHLNMWRQYYNPVDDKGDPVHKTAKAREEAFNKWMIKESEKLVKDGIIGHVHLTDNFGFGDEHLTPGQGNVPMREFLKKMERQGMKDMIVEPGSYNPTTAFTDTLALVNSPVYGVGRQFAPRFRAVQNQHFGYNAPPFFTGGAYVPSNDWRPWTEVPLE